MAFSFNASGIDPIFAYSNKILSLAGDADKATLFTTLSVAADGLGIIVGFILIERISRKILFLSGFGLVTLTCYLFFICGIANMDYLNKYLIMLFKFSFTTGIESVFWGLILKIIINLFTNLRYLPDILPMIGMAISF